jgi:hypothetical protein
MRVRVVWRVLLSGLLLAVAWGAWHWMQCERFAALDRPAGLAAALASHPNLLLTPDRLDFLRSPAALGNPAVAAALEDLARTADRLLGESPDPIAGALRVPGFYTDRREEHRVIVRRVRHEARVAHTLALAHAVTGNPEYAAHAKAYLFAWVDNLPYAEDDGTWWLFPIREHRGDTPLVIAYSFPAFIFAFDLLRGADVLSEEEVDRFRAWLRVFVDYHAEETLYKNNHHNWQVVFWLTAAHALEDPDLFHRAAVSYRRGLRGQIRADGALPRELWRGPRSGTYTLMALEGMVQAVHLMEHHGYAGARDWTSGQGADLHDALAFYRAYLDDPENWRQHTNADKLNVPGHIADWGYVFELPAAWWGEAEYAPYLKKRPYGLWVERCYTLDFATLLFAAGNPG